MRVVRAPCMGRCAGAPAARIGDREVDHATVDALLEMAKKGDTRVVVPEYSALPPIAPRAAISLLEKVRKGEVTAETLMATMQSAGLRGLGGAGFPAGKKWELVRSYPGPRLMSINGDEGEPGTFKDRIYLERDPHRTLEGALIAAHAVEAERIYFYMRDEYPAVLQILRTEIAALEAAGITKPGFIELRRGAGAYICGEESAMLESHRGQARHAAASSSLYCRGRPVRPPDAQPQCRDAVVDSRHRRERVRNGSRRWASPAIPAFAHGRFPAV